VKKTNFDKYLEEQLKDPEFAARFERAGEAWDVALQIALFARKPDFPRRTSRSSLRCPNSRSAGWNHRATKAIP
jgi:hypothetical protein